MRIPPNLRMDPDKRLSDLAREFAQLVGLASGHFMYSGGVLLERKTLRELNIPPEDVKTFMGISFGPVNEGEENKAISRFKRGRNMFIDREWTNQLLDNPAVFVIFDFDSEPLIINTARSLRRDISHHIRN